VALTRYVFQQKSRALLRGFFVAPQSFHRTDILRDGMIHLVWG